MDIADLQVETFQNKSRTGGRARFSLVSNTRRFFVGVLWFQFVTLGLPVFVGSYHRLYQLRRFLMFFLCKFWPERASSQLLDLWELFPLRVCPQGLDVFLFPVRLCWQLFGPVLFVCLLACLLVCLFVCLFVCLWKTGVTKALGVETSTVIECLSQLTRREHVVPNLLHIWLSLFAVDTSPGLAVGLYLKGAPPASMLADKGLQRPTCIATSGIEMNRSFFPKLLVARWFGTWTHPWTLLGSEEAVLFVWWSS